MTSRIFQPGLLDGQVAIVSGGGTGLGRATALELAELGAQVVVCGRRQEPLEETAAAAAEGRCEAVACDIREEQQVDELVDGVLERHGRVDLLVNNAGGQYLTPAEDITPKGFRTVIRLNVEGTWLMSHAVATRAMIPEERGGKIVNVASMLSFQGGLMTASYAAAKSGIAGLTHALANEWAPLGINVNAVAPGYIATSLTEGLRSDPGRSGGRAERRDALGDQGVYDP